MEATRTRVGDVDEQERVIKLFIDAFDAIRAYDNHRPRLIDHRFKA